MNTQFQTEACGRADDAEIEALVSALEAKWAHERIAREAAALQE